jgi:hypothetical protein
MRADDRGTRTGTRPQKDFWEVDVPLLDDDLSRLDDDVGTQTGTRPKENDEKGYFGTDFDLLA